MPDKPSPHFGRWRTGGPPQPGQPNTLLPPGVRLQALREAYYERLNKDETFQQALGTFFDRLNTIRAEQPEGLTNPLQRLVDALLNAEDEGAPLPPIKQVVAASAGPAGQVAAAIHAFRTEWPLPADSSPDLWWSYEAHHASPTDPPSLVAGPSRWELPPRGKPRTVAYDLPRVQAKRYVPEVVVEVEVRLPYDPVLTHDRGRFQEALDGELARIHAQAVAQADAIDAEVREAGWGRTPPGWGDPEAIDGYAYRLYLRAVKGYSWGMIAAETSVKREVAARHITKLATLLGIPLPAKPAVVRPRPRR